MFDHESFITRADQAMGTAVTTGHCFVFYIDITEFQLINRYYGMEQGNLLLKAIEDLLESIPEVAVFDRVFSDQFVFLVITEETVSSDKIKSCFRRYNEAFLAQHRGNFPACNLKISCGIYAMTGRNFTDAIDGANLARKEAKKYGSVSAVVFNHAIMDEISRSLKDEQDINMALQEGRFIFYLQPKVNILTGEIVGAEALARRIDAQGNLVYPDAFLKIMESSGSIVELDILIFRQVCAYLSDRLKKGLPVVRTSVNLSRLHIQNEETARLFHSIAREYRIPTEYIEFELTETIFLNEFEGAKSLIDQLRNFQYQVSIDDFGAGYAGINIWQELNFDTLKLDRKFLSEDEVVKSRNTAIVPNVINIAQRLGVDVICEGVETEEQCRYLLKLGCTTVQGYYFSEPVPKEDFYAQYRSLGGHYQVASIFDDDKGSEEPQTTAKQWIPRHHRPTQYLALVCLCSLFLAACATLALGINRKMSAHIFEQSISNTLDSYTQGHVAAVDARIASVTDTLGAFSALFARENSRQAIDNYLTALNESDPDVTYLFSTAEEFEERMRQGLAGKMDMAYIERMRNGETILSDVSFSNLAGDINCFSIGVPVFTDDTFAGGWRAIINADVLVSTEQYISPYGEVDAAFLVDPNGKILLTDGSHGIQGAEDGMNYIKSLMLSDETVQRLKDTFASGNGIQSFRLGEINDEMYYVSIASLNHNGWNTIVLFRASEANVIVNRLLHNTIISTLFLMAAILLVCIIMFKYLQSWRKKNDADEERYLLLEQFSDTVLFDYDSRNDIIRFTPNATQLFPIADWTQSGFLKYLSQSQNVYPADQATMEEVMTGKVRGEKNEVRVRLRHPSGERYYWCLIQYKYIYEKGRFANVIGKIVDIDEQQRHEDHLVEQALRDGLTNLYNKAASKKLIDQCLLEDRSGLLFMIDVDNFKYINDTYGHFEGDHALQAISECLKSIFRSNDIIGRIGGDELLVYMRKAGATGIVLQKMSMFWRLLSVYAEKYEIPITLSIGISRFPSDGQNFEELYVAADKALYEAKNHGKQQFCLDGKLYPFDSLT